MVNISCSNFSIESHFVAQNVKHICTFLFCLWSNSGITDHTNILPASLISPMGTDNSSYNYSMFDGADVSADSLLDVWADEMKWKHHTKNIHHWNCVQYFKNIFFFSFILKIFFALFSILFFSFIHDVIVIIFKQICSLFPRWIAKWFAINQFLFGIFRKHNC